MTAVQPEPRPRFSFRPLWLRADRASDPLLELQKSLRLFGVLSGIFMSVHAYVTPFTHIDLVSGNEMLWVLTILGFFVAFVLSTYTPNTSAGRRNRLLLSAIAAGLALLANNLINGNSVLAGLLLIVSMQVGTVLPMRLSVPWILVQTAALLDIFARTWENTDAWAYASGYLFFQLFALVTADTLMREITARKKLAAALEELRATRALLSEASRQAERLEISRELHDVVGHHLTALSMNLQVASHLTPPSPAKPYLEKSQEVARSLLTDVRTTVRGLRHTASGSDFQQDLRELVSTVPLTVHLEFSPQFSLTSPIHAHVLLRTAQEILTNAVRHAQASQVWLHLERSADTVLLQARDDGRGGKNLQPGCGLKGMRERLESIGGHLTIQPNPGVGLALCASVPLGTASTPLQELHPQEREA